jgi:hypothetical protein
VPKRHSQTKDKQLAKLNLARLVRKREMDQAFNMKEFAVLADISYSQARTWFRKPGFPAIGGYVFWADFVVWRQSHSGLSGFLEQSRHSIVIPTFDSALSSPRQRASAKQSGEATFQSKSGHVFTGKCAQILRDAGC